MLLNEDQSFQMSGYVETPGYIRVIPRGYLVSERSDGTYIAPLIPQLFYGAAGEQLITWRQNIPSAGEHVILSRVAGEPKVPREELFWRKVRTRETIAKPQLQAGPPIVLLILIGAAFLLFGTGKV